MYPIETVDLIEQPTLVIRDKVAPGDIPQWMAAAYGEISGYMAQTGVQPTGPPFACYLLLDGVFEIEAGFPVASLIKADNRIEPSHLPPGPAATTMHIGPYETLPAALEAVNDWIKGHSYEEVGPFWEVYLTDPNQEPDVSRWQTQVLMPYRRP